MLAGKKQPDDVSGSLKTIIYIIRLFGWRAGR